MIGLVKLAFYGIGAGGILAAGGFGVGFKDNAVARAKAKGSEA